MGLSPSMVTNTITIIITKLSSLPPNYPPFHQKHPNERHLSPGDHGPQSWQNSGSLLQSTTFLKLPEPHHDDDYAGDEGVDEEDVDCDVDDHVSDYDKDENDSNGGYMVN